MNRREALKRIGIIAGFGILPSGLWVPKAHAFSPLTVCGGAISAVGDGSVGGVAASDFVYNRDNTEIYLSSYTATAGAVNYAHVFVDYLGGGYGVAEIGLWDSSGNFITSAQSDALGTSQNDVWINVTLSSQQVLTATTYIVGVAASVDPSWKLGTSTDTSDGSGAVSGTPGSFGNITPPSFAGLGYQIVFNNSLGDPS
jgi:hypothetical protein